MSRPPLPRWLGAAAALAGLALMALGIWRQEVQVLFTKAINICLECVGIG